MWAFGCLQFWLLEPISSKFINNEYFYNFCCWTDCLFSFLLGIFFNNKEVEANKRSKIETDTIDYDGSETLVESQQKLKTEQYRISALIFVFI